MINAVLISIIIVSLVIGSLTDLKQREVPDFLTYGLIAAGIGIRLIYSVFSFDFSFLLYGILGVFLCFLVAALMFYTGQWGGGDAKMLMGLGALVGFEFSFNSFIIGMLINILLIGAFYGLIWGIVLAFKNSKQFSKEFLRLRSQIVFFERFGFGIFLALLLLGLFNPNPFFKVLFILLGIVPLMVVYVWLFAKAVENCCMIKYVKPLELTEGDWIAETVKVKGKTIASPKDLGIEMPQIRKLIKLNVKKVLIKQGIPFLPSFLFGYIATLLVYYSTGISNWLLFFV